MAVLAVVGEEAAALLNAPVHNDDSSQNSIHWKMGGR
ncbi:MAG: hypothetical protein JWP83_5320 [Mycobacterium sp.]|jgi:hypothetical protein|nr:hypothetical protein [Mycobacterium sp.]